MMLGETDDGFRFDDAIEKEEEWLLRRDLKTWKEMEEEIDVAVSTGYFC